MKNIGAIMLIAGTAIGSGMLALPITLAKLGIKSSILLMILTSLMTYYSALINLELHLHSNTKNAMSLGKLARYFGGPTAEFIGALALKLLSIALMAVFIYAGSSISVKLLYNLTLIEYKFENIAYFYSAFSFALLIAPMKLTDYINRMLFISLLCVVGIIVLSLSTTLNFSSIPELNNSFDIFLWSHALPIVFTSFGFQGSIPTIVDYCGKSPKTLKNIFLWGSIIPMIVYLFWTITILLVIYQHNPSFYSQMLNSNIEVSALIEQLVHIGAWQYIKVISWWISFFAILTSVIGVGIGLVLSFQQQFKLGQVNSALMAVIPACFIAIQVPNAFITVLGFAGMLLSLIAIILPVYLITKIFGKEFYYLELKNGLILITVLVFGVLIILSEIVNMLC